MTIPRLLVALAALLAVSSPRLAAADQDDTRARDRTIFYAALAVTGASVATWAYAGTRVLAAEDDLDELGPQLEPEDAPDGYYTDICAAVDAADGSVAAEVRSTCRRGKRWQTITNVSQVVTLGSAVVTAIFAYRAFRSPVGDQRPAAPARSALRAHPIATPSAVGLGLDVEF